MPYLPDIPQDIHVVADSRAPLAEDFAVIDTAFGVDHVSFNNEYSGYHSVVRFLRVPLEGYDDGPLELNIQRADQDPRPVTFVSPSTAMTPSNIIFKYGTAVLSAGLTTTVNLVTENEPTPAIFFNIQVMLTGHLVDSEPMVHDIEVNQVVIENNGNQGKTIHYIAIGS